MVISNFPILEITENNPPILRTRSLNKKTGDEKREPEDLASALVTVVQSINESKCPDAFFEPLMKAITEMLKDETISYETCDKC